MIKTKKSLPEKHRPKRHSTHQQRSSMATFESMTVLTSVLASVISQSSEVLWNVQGKTCIVTGASSGIGLQTALSLVKRGARVILGCRNGQAAEEAIIYIRRFAHLKSAEQAARTVTWAHLDLGSMSSVRRFANDILLNEKKLHILVNNAAVIMPRKRQVRIEGNLEETWATNHFGPFLLTNLLLPLLKDSAPSRVVMVTDKAYKLCRNLHDGIGINLRDPQCDTCPKEFDAWIAYCQTKLANILFARNLTRRLNETGTKHVTVCCVYPGACRSNLFRNQPRKYSSIFGMLRSKFALIPAREAAQNVVSCVCQNGSIDSREYYSKQDFVALEEFALDEYTATKLWRLSERLTGLYPLDSDGNFSNSSLGNFYQVPEVIEINHFDLFNY